MSQQLQDAIYFISVKYCTILFLSRRLIPRCPVYSPHRKNGHYIFR